MIAGRPILIALLWLLLAAGCARPPATGITSIKATTQSELQGYLLSRTPDVDQFRLRGPFAVVTRENQELRLSDADRVDSDLYLAAPAEKSALVVIVHGHDASKEAHAYQAMHLASWGMHAMTVQLQTNGPWTANGKILARIVNYVHRRPEMIDSRIDVNRIILVGHSFGGYAVAVALAQGAPAAGAVLLDPAGIGRDVPGYLKQVNAPVMVLGADEHISTTRNREYFFRFIRGRIAEVSLKNTTHDDAQYPAEHAFGSDATEEAQITFVSALTSACLSLSATGKFDYAWTSFGDGAENGRFFNARKK